MPPRAKLFIPQVIAPPIGCITIAVPDDAEWRALFFGALDQLQLWNSYERDSGPHNGKVVADIWRTILNNAYVSDCPPSKRINWYVQQDFTTPQSSPRGLFKVTDFSYVDPAFAIGFSGVGGGGLTNYDLAFFDSDTGSPVGGPIESLFLHSWDGLNLGGTLAWIDCVGTAHSQGIPAVAGFNKTNFDARHITIASTRGFFMGLNMNTPHC